MQLKNSLDQLKNIVCIFINPWQILSTFYKKIRDFFRNPKNSYCVNLSVFLKKIQRLLVFS